MHKICVYVCESELTVVNDDDDAVVRLCRLEIHDVVHHRRDLGVQQVRVLMYA